MEGRGTPSGLVGARGRFGSDCRGEAEELRPKRELLPRVYMSRTVDKRQCLKLRHIWLIELLIGRARWRCERGLQIGWQHLSG